MRTVDPERHAARRGHILAAAAEVFAELGYDAATTAAVCRRAGIGSGTLFHYFPDKRSILAGLVADEAATKEAALAHIDRSSPTALDEVIDLLADDLGDPLVPGLTLAMLQLALRDAGFSAALARIDDHARQVLADVIGRGRAAGTVDADVDPVRAARWVVGVIDAAYFMAGEDGFEPVADAAELRRMIHRYLGTRG